MPRSGVISLSISILGGLFVVTHWSYGDVNPCSPAGIIKTFLNALPSETLESVIDKQSLPKTLADRYRSTFGSAEVAEKDVLKVIKKIKKLPTDEKQVHWIEWYVAWAKQKNPEERLKAFRELPVLFTDKPLMTNFVKSFYQERTTAILSQALKDAELSEYYTERYAELLRALSLTGPEAETVSGVISKIGAGGDPERLDLYLRYLATLDRSKRVQAVQDIPFLTAETEHASPYVQRFIKREKAFDDNEKKTMKRAMDLYFADEKDAADIARAHRRNFEDLWLGCHAKEATPENKNAAAAFSRFRILIGLASTGISYGVKHGREEKNSVWFEKLGYEMTMGLVISSILTRFTVNPADNLLQKNKKAFYFGTLSSFLNSRIYGALFGVNDGEAEKRVRELEKDPEFKKNAEELLKYLDNERFFPRFEAELANLFRKDGPVLNNKMDDILSDDMNAPEVRKILERAMTAKMYEQAMGEWIRTGDRGMDRFLFNNLWAQPVRVKDVSLDSVIFQMLCMGKMRPERTLAMAITVFAANKLVTDMLYFNVRDKAIHM